MIRRILLVSALWLIGAPSFAADELIILSPHRKSIQEEFVPAFVEYYKKTYGTDVRVDWLDQGGTSDDIRFLKAKFARNPKTSGVDLFWGGGTSAFLDLKEIHLLEKHTPEAVKNGNVPRVAAGIPLWDDTHTWHASAMSSFGIFFNRKALKNEKKPEPKTWEDLANPVYRDDISLTDPRRSGSANTMNAIILQSLGWEKGWQLLTAIAGNARSFTHSSSDPIKAVVSGDAVAAMAIDFYALAKVADLGQENLGFVLPAGQTVLDPDPIGIVKGAPNRKVAERFIDFVLSKDAQKLLVLPKGVPFGPTRSTLGRMAVNVKTYAETEGQRTDPTNPFLQKDFLTMDMSNAAREKRIFDDLFGSMLIDTHHDLKRAWAALVRKGMSAEELAALGKPPVTQAEFKELASKWSDDVFRNRTINEWVSYAKKKYSTAAH